jgi:uridylate kinase
LIKISGETLSGADGKFGLNEIATVCDNVKNVIDSGIKVCLVIGGGNIVRGRDFQKSDLIASETADSIGMLSTVMNGIFMRDALRARGLYVEAVSALRLPFGILPNDVFTVRELASRGAVIIFCGGVGLPYFSTDTVAVIAASMARCDALLKATKTDGIYDADPKIFDDAKHIPELTHSEAIQRNLQVMDQTAFVLASQRKLPIYVFAVNEPNCFMRAINGELKLSVVRSDSTQ